MLSQCNTRADAVRSGRAVPLFVAEPGRYEWMPYRRVGAAASSCRRSRSACGRTSATTGRSRPSRAILRRAFDLGITHFDLANNYGPPVRRRRGELRPHLREDFRALPRGADHLDQGRL